MPFKSISPIGSDDDDSPPPVRKQSSSRPPARTVVSRPPPTVDSDSDSDGAPPVPAKTSSRPVNRTASTSVKTSQPPKKQFIKPISSSSKPPKKIVPNAVKKVEESEDESDSDREQTKPPPARVTRPSVRENFKRISSSDDDEDDDEPKDKRKAMIEKKPVKKPVRNPEEERTKRRRDDLKSEIREYLSEIPDEYKAKNFNPLPSVVKVLQTRGPERERKLDELERYYEYMDRAMNDIVSEYFVGFNKTTRNYTSIQKNVDQSRQNVQNLKRDLEKIKSYLASRSKALRSMWRQQMEYKETISILEKIEDLKAIPHRLEEYIEKKHYLQAARILVKSVNSLFGEDLMEIGALSDLRRDLLEMKTTFHERLIDELQDVVYLRNPHAIRDEDKESIAAFQNASISIRDREGIDAVKSRFKSFEDRSKGLEVQELEDNLEEEAERDIQHFMAIIVDSLSILDRIPTALASLNNQVGIQLLSIINQLMDEVRRDEGKRGEEEGEKKEREVEKVWYDLIRETNVERSKHPLVKLLMRLCPRWYLIARNHIFLTNLINTRYVAETEAEEQLYNSSLPPDSLKPLKRCIPNPYKIDGVWSVMQLQMETLIGLHLGNEFKERTGQTSVTGGGNILYRREKLFSFSNSSAATFTSGNEQENSHSNTNGGAGLGYSMGQALEEPSPHNLTPIYPIITNFDLQVEQMIPKQNSALTHVGIKFFIDDYVVNTYLDYVRGDFEDRLSDSLIGFEAYKLVEPRHYSPAISETSERQLLQSSVHVYLYIRELIVNIITMPAYTKSFISILQSTLLRFLEAYRGKFEEILRETETGKRIKNVDMVQLLNTDPVWSTREMRSVSVAIESNPRFRPNSKSTNEEVDAFHEIELAMEASLFPNSYPINSVLLAATQSATGAIVTPAVIEPSIVKSNDETMLNPFLVNQLTLPRETLITDVGKLSLVANMNNSLEWLLVELQKLFITPLAVFTEAQNSLKGSKNRSRKGSVSSAAPIDEGVTLIELEPDLDKVTKKLAEISILCLYAMRTELRVHCYYYLNEAVRSSYHLETEVLEPDPAIIDLNRDLSTIEEALSPYLPKIKLKYLFYSLPPLISNVLIKSLLRKIKSVNKNGVLKMCRNVFALQQNLTNIVQFKEVYFNKVRRYYLLLNSTEEELLAQIKTSISENKINSLEEFKTIKTILEFKAANRRNQGMEIFENTVVALDDFFHTLQKTKMGTTLLWDGLGDLTRTINTSLQSLVQQ
ncbi:exocyst complex component 4 isoform a [Planoprotostelium fungivorum]|uniref:Exocyst complex component Sec8 n=1 Tax=Planoprotostelium fungivorum TaxID=1890364 RepID=A0A2P6MQU1_9EUKA|nr:exocyst complex component 4 isoform a [Planoprotostelium fungivorum]